MNIKYNNNLNSAKNCTDRKATNIRDSGIVVRSTNLIRRKKERLVLASALNVFRKFGKELHHVSRFLAILWIVAHCPWFDLSFLMAIKDKHRCPTARLWLVPCRHAGVNFLLFFFAILRYVIATGLPSFLPTASIWVHSQTCLTASKGRKKWNDVMNHRFVYLSWKSKLANKHSFRNSSLWV